MFESPRSRFIRQEWIHNSWRAQGLVQDGVLNDSASRQVASNLLIAEMYILARSAHSPPGKAKGNTNMDQRFRPETPDGPKQTQLPHNITPCGTREE
jgi:hypothetical protein